jgi:hypothetical protein
VRVVIHRQDQARVPREALGHGRHHA